MKSYMINGKKYAIDEEMFRKNVTTQVNEDLTLAELRTLVGCTEKWKKTPSGKYLRSCRNLVAGVTRGDCRVEAYDCSYAVYQAQGRVSVVYLGSIGTAHYNAEPSIGLGSQDIDLEDENWAVAVMLEGERRIERWSALRDANNLISITENGGIDEETGEAKDMEFDSGVDVEREVMDRMEAEDVKGLLTEQQLKCAEMYYGIGLTQEEIGKALGISQRAVSYHLNGAKKKVKGYLTNS